MADIGVFPLLPGLAWSVTKAPTFQTRIQRAVSGRELRALDYPFPLWQFTLNYDFLTDNRTVGLNDLRKLMGFYMLCQGAFGTFLFNDPTDNAATGQVLPAASSTVNSTSISAGGSGYVTGDVVQLSIGVNGVNQGQYYNGTVPTPASWLVTGVTGGGGLTGLSLINGGSYTIVPGSAAITLTGGSGSGASVNLGWSTTTQLVRLFGDPSLPAGGYPGNPALVAPNAPRFGGGFVEPITAPTTVGSIYFNGISQSGWSVDASSGVVSLPVPFGPFYEGSTFSISSGGTSYIVGDFLTLTGGTLASSNPALIPGGVVGPTQFIVNTVGAGGVITALTFFQNGNYSVVPGVTALSLSGGLGTGAAVNMTWQPFPQPVITADFSYYFRCRFIDDSYSFENFMRNLWQLKKIAFISVRP